jgi:hypothetical protein
MTTTITEAIFNNISEDELKSFASRIGPFLPFEPVEGPRWMGARSAAAYLGISYGEIRKLAAANQIPYDQDRPNCRLWFFSTALDDWRAKGGARAVAGRLV